MRLWRKGKREGKRNGKEKREGREKKQRGKEGFIMKMGKVRKCDEVKGRGREIKKDNGRQSRKETSEISCDKEK